MSLDERMSQLAAKYRPLAVEILKEVIRIPADYVDRGPEEGGCFLYGRHFNPTVYVLGKQIAAFEGADAGYCTASGMSAVAGAVMQLCGTGDHVVSSDTVYGGTFALFNEFLKAIPPIIVDTQIIINQGSGFQRPRLCQYRRRPGKQKGHQDKEYNETNGSSRHNTPPCE